EFADRDDRVKLRRAAPELVPFLGHDAAGDRDRPLRRLPLFQLVELRIDPILCCLADDAGVEDGHVRAVERVFLVTGCQEFARQTLRVSGVHLAPDRPDVERPSRQRLSTSSRIPVRSSPSIEMSMKAVMQTRSRAPCATYPREMAIAFTAWLIAPAPIACTSTRPLLRITPAMAPATATGLEVAETFSTSTGARPSPVIAGTPSNVFSVDSLDRCCPAGGSTNGNQYRIESHNSRRH